MTVIICDVTIRVSFLSEQTGLGVLRKSLTIYMKKKIIIIQVTICKDLIEQRL